MRDISHGAKCARILKRIDEAIGPGIEFENGYYQQQTVMLGPVGNLFYSVKVRDGRYVASVNIIKRSKDKGSGEQVERVHTSREVAYDTFEEALSRAASLFAAALSKETAVVDYALTYKDYLSEVLAESRKRYARESEDLKSAINMLRHRYGHILRGRDELSRLLRRAGVSEDEFWGEVNKTKEESHEKEDK